MRYTVDVKAFVQVTVEADSEDQARERADGFVEWLSPTNEQIQDFNTDHDPIEDCGSFDVDGDSEVEEIL